jgi:hypothetical protein
LEWYDLKATTNKTWHMRLGITIIICGALTSVVQLWVPSTQGVHWTTWLTAILGAIVIVTKGVDTIWKFDENWTNYRQAAEGLKREQRLYINAAGPYVSCQDEDARFNLFINTVEDIIVSEGHFFWKNNTKNSDKERN